MQKELISHLRNKYGETFYLLNTKQFKANFCELKKAFSKYYKNFNIAYSYKTNYIPKLCDAINQLGGYAEVVSEMELELAKRIGVAPRSIIWNGPIKNATALEKALLEGITINIDSLDELKLIKPIVTSNPSIIFQLGIRVNFDIGDGIISRFGFDVDSEDYKQCLKFIEETKNANLVNLQCHFAKRNIEYWPERAKTMLRLIGQLKKIPSRIDLGGGMFGKMEDTLKSQFSTYIPTYEEYAKAVAQQFSDYFGDDGPELIVEPGSALVGDCMQLVTTIKTIKNVKGKWFATVLASQKNISMTSVNPPIEVVHMGETVENYKSINIVGYTCIEGDVIYKNYEGELAKQDVIIISNCGSYSIVMKPPFILPNFAVIDVSENKEELIKQPETFEDIFSGYYVRGAHV